MTTRETKKQRRERSLARDFLLCQPGSLLWVGSDEWPGRSGWWNLPPDFRVSPPGAYLVVPGPPPAQEEATPCPR
jgi:hypothetical protein